MTEGSMEHVYLNTLQETALPCVTPPQRRAY
ncbi:hypothetical protein M2163_001031 [Streptomyces sp. SAI-135]|nr:hypothetical protein [Streptomyces sp. SAI-135]